MSMNDIVKRRGIFCPNHGEPLELSLDQLTATKGTAPCPISKCLFDFTQEVDETKMVQDKYGNLIPTKTFKVEGDEE